MPRDVTLDMLLLRVTFEALFVARFGIACACAAAEWCVSSKLVVRAAEIVDCVSLPVLSLRAEVVELVARGFRAALPVLRSAEWRLLAKISWSFSEQREGSTTPAADGASRRDDVGCAGATVIGWK